MAKFNQIERKLADILNSAPKIKEALKRIYISVNYRLYKEKKTIKLNDQYKITSASDFFQVKLNAPYFFGYYDISPWSMDNQFYLVHEFKDKVTLNILLLSNGNKQVIGTTSAWNWQQGSMLQWLDHEKIIYNDFNDGALGSYIFNTRTQDREFIPYPVQAVFKQGALFLSINYNTLTKLRPEYGYSQLGNNFEELPAEKDGIWEVNYKSKKASLILSLEDLKGLIPKRDNHVSSKINHVTYSPDGLGVVFMLRWYLQSGEKKSQLLYFSKENKKISVLLNNKVVSHYSWL
ncbi:MAG: hypothetical protein R3321_10710, partial [Nitrososphaeraceae archaeon]|nr:hypothetical protein [Nitrososphaeraceae archaeon]